jgi:hypothetical protein
MFGVLAPQVEYMRNVRRVLSLEDKTCCIGDAQ